MIDLHIIDDDRSSFRKKMRSFFVEKTTKEFTTSKDFWKFYNKYAIKTKKSKETQIISNIIDPFSNITVSEPAEIANAFNYFFTNINGDSKKLDISNDSNISTEESLQFIDEQFLQFKRNGLFKNTTFSFKSFTEAM